MSRIKQLLNSYGKFISIPWQNDIAPAQRVIFCIYNEQDELRLRAKIDEFEITTKNSGHDWLLFDLTDTFPSWLSSQKYAGKYFEKPDLLPVILHKYLNYITEEFKKFIERENPGENTVVALKGTGTVYGFLRVKDLVEHLAPYVKGRFLVFFPGTYDNNNYRLLNGYDGWNYLAIPITADKDF